MSLNFPDEISEVTLDSGRYYKPIAPNVPFFDSFAIDCDVFVISIFRISSEHRGSAKGFGPIRKIMAHVVELLEEAGHPATKVEVVYFLVCLAGEHERKWHMPLAWEKDTDPDDHRGSAFCIKLQRAATPRYVTSIHSQLCDLAEPWLGVGVHCGLTVPVAFFLLVSLLLVLVRSLPHSHCLSPLLHAYQYMFTFRSCDTLHVILPVQ